MGIIPGWSGTQRMVRRFGAGVTRRMALFGEIFIALEALSLGLIDRVCETNAGTGCYLQVGTPLKTGLVCKISGT